MSKKPNTATEKDLGLKIVECDGCPLTRWGCTHHIIGFERDHVERGLSSIDEAHEIIDYIRSCCRSQTTYTPSRRNALR